MTDEPGRRVADRPAAPGAEAALARRVRWKLLAWSGGSTLVVLLVLGTLLYVAVARSLGDAATDQLRARASLMIRRLAAGPVMTPPSPNVITTNAAQPGVLIGGGVASGTVGFVSIPSLNIQVFDSSLEALGVNDMLQVDLGEAVAANSEVVREATASGTAIRVLTVPVSTPVGTAVVQILGDRTTEERTLGVLLSVLVAGGLVAVLASLGVGWLYADRALVPIRDSMRRQREFAADASHELRTPLALVRGSIDHLTRHPTSRVAEVGDVLDDLRAGSDRLAALVDDLLLLARTDSGAIELELEPTDLAELALDAAGRFATLAAERGIDLRVDAEPVPIRADADRIRQVVGILVDNAVSHTHAAGGRSVEIGVRAVDGRAVLTVEDDGPGVRPDDRARIFDRFWRAEDAPPGGTGLGLAIARWIVDRHEGSISVTNRLVGGARFEVRLPGLLPVADPERR